MQLLSLPGMADQGRVPGSVDPNSAGGAGTTVSGGSTQFPYQTYDQPYTGVPSGMVTKKGITLQQGPMRSLWQIARESNLLPGAREIGQIGQGYRSYSDQVSGYAQSPGRFAPPGQSYHGQGLAIDAGWWTDRPQLLAALQAAGWNQLPSEDWHFSYGVSG